MKLKIKVLKTNNLSVLPRIIKKGEYIDLHSSETISFKAPQSGTLKKVKVGNKEESFRNVTFDTGLIPLGVAMQLPKGFEAIVVPRSSTFRTWGLIQTNSMGIIDNSYCGNTDEWKFPVLATKETTVANGDRVCQFRIQLSQKATLWQKLKWLLSSGIEIKETPYLESKSREGFGSTGIR